MSILAAVLHLGQARLEAIVLDGGGARRKIEFTWVEKEKTDVVPAHWPSAVRAEAEFQRAEDLAEASGRRIP